MKVGNEIHRREWKPTRKQLAWFTILIVVMFGGALFGIDNPAFV